jgi:hypothetical protein
MRPTDGPEHISFILPFPQIFGRQNDHDEGAGVPTSLRPFGVSFSHFWHFEALTMEGKKKSPENSRETARSDQARCATGKSKLASTACVDVRRRCKRSCGSILIVLCAFLVNLDKL